MKKLANIRLIEKIAEPYLSYGPIIDSIAQEDAQKLSAELTAAFDNVYCSILPDGPNKKLFTVCSSSTNRIFLRAEITEK